MQPAATSDAQRTTTVILSSGTLHVTVERADLSLDQLCGFASRRSRKRGFVFVSKVLGKHYPVRPRCMNEVFERLAGKLVAALDRAASTGPVLVIAMAETATALGQGVYEELWRRTQRDDLLFLHTTRYHLQQPPALQFDENHSHATEHFLYEPADAEQRRFFHQATTLILIDDEITTGNTLANLAYAYHTSHTQLNQVHFVCLTNWLNSPQNDEIECRVGIPVSVHSLLRGTFSFTEDADFNPGVIPNVTGNNELKDRFLPGEYGRLGRLGPIDLAPHIRRQLPQMTGRERVLVLGTGEFAYPPYRLARALEEDGHDVFFQTTTRSPLRVERDLASALEFTDNYHDNIANFVYNVVDKTYDRIIIGYETRPLPDTHKLAESLAAEVVFF